MFENALLVGDFRTSYPSVLSRFPAYDDAGVAGNIGDAGVKEGAVRRRDEHRRFLATRLASLHVKFHAACAEGGAPQPTDHRLKTSKTPSPVTTHTLSTQSLLPPTLYSLINHLT